MPLTDRITETLIASYVQDECTDNDRDSNPADHFEWKTFHSSQRQTAGDRKEDLGSILQRT